MENFTFPKNLKIGVGVPKAVNNLKISQIFDKFLYSSYLLINYNKLSIFF